MTEPDAAPRGLADHVDAFWDALVRGAPPAADPLAPELTAEIRRLHDADRTPHADSAFLAGLQEELAMTPTAPRASPPLRPRGFAPTSNRHVSVAPAAAQRPAPQSRRRWRGAVERLVAAVLVLGLASGYLALQAGTPPAGEGPPAARLFHVGSDDRTLTALDPGTLATLPDATPEAVPGPVVSEGSDWGDVTSQWTLSPDGSTSISVEYPVSLVGFEAEKMDIVVRDGLAGPERIRFDPPALILPEVGVSDDGRRILAVRTEIDPLRGFPGTADPPTWFVLDAVDGRTLATIRASERGPLDDARAAWLSPGGDRVYRLGAGGPSSGSGPGPARLVAYDAASGDEIASLDLPEVRVGTWTTERRINDRSVTEYAVVGTALSPDGRRLALVGGDGPTVTIVDTERLVVERTLQTGPHVGDATPQPEPVATPFLQRPAAGEPYVQGSNFRAVYAADGRGMYVGGGVSMVGATGSTTFRDFGLRRIDLETGAVVGELTLPDAANTLTVDAIRGDVYVLESPPGFEFEELGSVLRRLDAETLEILAERELTGHPLIELTPRLGDGW